MNTFSRKNALRAILLAASACIAVPANAAVLLQQIETAAVAPFFISNPGGGNTATGVSLIDVLVDPFDDSLGDLVSVRFLPSVTVEGFLPSTTGGSLSLTAAGDLGVDGATYNSVSESRSRSTSIGSVRADVTLTDDTTIDAASTDATDLSILASVTGSAPYSYTLTGDQFFNRFLTGTLEVTEGLVTVEYNYTAAIIPEPTSLTVFAALAATTAALRRRNRNAC